MSSILDQIVDRKREEIAAAGRDTPLSRLEDRVADAGETRDFFGRSEAMLPTREPG